MFEGRGWVSQLKQKVNSPFLPLQALFKPAMDWLMPTHTGEGDLLYCLWIQMLVSSRHPHRHTQK